MHQITRTRRTRRLPILLAASLCLGSVSALHAQDTSDLSRAATDPTAPLLAINFINDFRSSYYDSDDSGYEVRFQPVIPFNAWGYGNILRVVVPYQVGGPGNEGLKNVSVFDLVVFPQDWGRFGVGPVASMTQSDSETASKFAIGPAIGGVAQISETWSAGAFNQNLFGNDVAISQFQPIVTYQMGGGWSLSAGDLQFVYDWNGGRFVSVPLGFQIGVVTDEFGQPIRFSVNPQWNLKNIEGANKTKVIFTVTILAPAGG